jgi:hypothetical protein
MKFNDRLGESHTIHLHRILHNKARVDQYGILHMAVYLLNLWAHEFGIHCMMLARNSIEEIYYGIGLLIVCDAEIVMWTETDFLTSRMLRLRKIKIVCRTSSQRLKPRRSPSSSLTESFLFQETTLYIRCGASPVKIN